MCWNQITRSIPLHLISTTCTIPGLGIDRKWKYIFHVSLNEISRQELTQQMGVYSGHSSKFHLGRNWVASKGDSYNAHQYLWEWIRIYPRTSLNSDPQISDTNKPEKIQCPDNKIHGANMGSIWGRQDPGGPHVGPMNFAIWLMIS